MDLIYMNSNFVDIGILQNYSLDLAYGRDENDFVLEMPLDSPRCEAGDYIYMDGTEYGGIIDTIGADTNAGKLIYKGRSWFGILNSKVLTPFSYSRTVDGKKVVRYDSYLNVYGDANEILDTILIRIGLTRVFSASTEESGIEINNYNFRFEKAFDGIFEMLSEYNARLNILCQGGKPILSVVPIMNYSTSEGFESDIVHMKVEQTFHLVNHLICLGSGELQNRHIINLYTDENGGIQPYLYDMTRPPIKDSDYILNNDYSTMKSENEIAEVYDYPSVETVENFELLESEPSDWSSGYFNYYKKSNGEYEQIEKNMEEDYQLTTSQPSNWNSSYDGFFTRYWSWNDGGWVYEPVEGDETETYVEVTSIPRSWESLYMNYYYKDGNTYKPFEQVESFVRQNSQPSDWSTSYSNYYTTDGVSYSSVSGVTKYRYKVQTTKPSDWSTNWGNYYGAVKEGNATRYVILRNHPSYVYYKKAPTWKKNTFYIRESYQVAPTFSSLGQVYRLTSSPPTWGSKTAYAKTITYSKQWHANTFWQKVSDKDAGLDFRPNVYYRLVYDHYANLVAGGIERLTELANADTLDVTIDETGEEYSIGDIISATEQVTGVSTAQRIVKKIVKVERDVLTVRHEVS